MTNFQEGVEKMTSSCLSFLGNNATITATIPNFSVLYANIQNACNQLLPAKMQQEADKKSNTGSKKQLRASLINQSIEMSRRMVAYASNINNVQLLELINYTISDLKRSSDSKLVSICQIIRDSANTNVTALTPYGVTATNVTGLQTSITNFSTSITKSRIAQSSCEGATSTLENLFNTILYNWKRIDILVGMLRYSNPSFYNEYQSVRKVVVNGKTSLSLKIKVYNAETNQPESNVSIRLTPSDGSFSQATSVILKRKEKDKKTAAGGGAHYKNLPEGTYIVWLKKPGLKDVMETINIVNGELKVLEVRMEKLG